MNRGSFCPGREKGMTNFPFVIKERNFSWGFEEWKECFKPQKARMSQVEVLHAQKEPRNRDSGNVLYFCDYIMHLLLYICTIKEHSL